METEQIHQLYASADEANIALAIQLAKGQRLGIQSLNHKIGLAEY